MTARSERIALAAEQLEGVAFRLHGRDPATGLDCIGLACCALERAGIAARLPRAYALRNSRIDRFLDGMEVAGLAATEGEARRGDFLLVQPAVAQHHLLVALGRDRFAHAHAGLRRVVIQTGHSGWPILHHWRIAER